MKHAKGKPGTDHGFQLTVLGIERLNANGGETGKSRKPWSVPGFLKEIVMEYHETLPRRGISRKAMLKRVARFKKLKGTDGGLPDSKMPGCERILYNVIGFQPPRVEKNGKQSPVGDIAARLAAIKI